MKRRKVYNKFLMERLSKPQENLQDKYGYYQDVFLAGEAEALLCRAIEAIEHTIDLDDGNLTESERQWVIDQAITTVTDIREALKEDR